MNGQTVRKRVRDEETPPTYSLCDDARGFFFCYPSAKILVFVVLFFSQSTDKYDQIFYVSISTIG